MNLNLNLSQLILVGNAYFFHLIVLKVSRLWAVRGDV